MLTVTYKSKVRYYHNIIGVFMVFQLEDLQRVAFAKDILFKMSGVICLSLLPSTLSDKLSTDIRYSNGLFSTQKVCMISDSSCKMADCHSSLFSVKELLSFLAQIGLVCGRG